MPNSDDVYDDQFLDESPIYPCPCGSGLESYPEYDARAIYLCRCCDDCRDKKLSEYRPQVLNDPNYAVDEPIDPEDY